MTLYTTINRINNALNYPSATIDDLKLFLDQAIAELNSTLHISIPLLDTMLENQRSKVLDKPNLILLASEIAPGFKIPTSSAEPVLTENVEYYYNTDTSKYGILANGAYAYYDELYGIYNNLAGTVITYKAVKLNSITVTWYRNDNTNPENVEFSDYLPDDWVILFVIPYVCFKYAIREGDSGSLFSEEFSQGYQQLQNGYDIPHKVNLVKVSHLPAYNRDVKENLNNLNICVVTKSIQESMKIPREVLATFGSMYDKGGWGL